MWGREGNTDELLELAQGRGRARTRDRLPRKAARARSPTFFIASAAQVALLVLDPAKVCPATLATALIAHVLITATWAAVSEADLTWVSWFLL